MYIIIGIVGIIAFFIIAIIIFMDSDNSEKEEKKKDNTNTISETQQNKDDSEVKDNFDYEVAAQKQMAEPEKGETIAVMHVKGYGDITFKFFADKAPKAVENFLTHSKDGYYNGVKFHRVMKDFMIQGGDPKGNGTGGESIWGKGFEEEFDDGLVPYRGALCMASSGVGTSSLGSQFFIVQANYDKEMADMMVGNGGFPQGLVKQYERYGGYLSLYKNYTVFGQVVNGMDVVDKIVEVEKSMSSTGELSSPIEDVIIESIDVTEKQ